MEYTQGLDTPTLSTNAARDKIVRDLLQKAYTGGVDPERDKRVAAAWEARFGMPFITYKPAATYLHGFPGNGKTTAFYAAAKEVADLLGMNLIENPETPVPVGYNDLVLVIPNLSGEISNMAVSGIPKIDEFKLNDEDDPIHFTRRVPPFALAAACSAGLALVVFDDMKNASPNVQNVANDMLDRGRAQGLDLGAHALCGATGNLGAVDGTHVHSTSAATATRANNYIMFDNVQDWCERTTAQYKDRIGDAGLVAFFALKQDYFHKPTGNKKGEPYPTPRTWSRALEEHLRPLYAYHLHSMDKPGGQNATESALIQATDYVAGLLGKETAEVLSGFYRNYLSAAMPLAQQIMDNNMLDKNGKEILKAKYGAGVKDHETAFVTQLYGALCDIAAPALVAAYKAKDDAAFKDVTQKLMTGLYGLVPDRSHVGWATNYLSGRIVALADDTNIGALDPSFGAPTLSLTFIDKLTQAVNGHQDACAEYGESTVFSETFLPEVVRPGVNDMPTMAPDIIGENKLPSAANQAGLF